MAAYIASRRWETALVEPVGPEVLEAVFGAGFWAGGAHPPARENPTGLRPEVRLVRKSVWQKLWQAGASQAFAGLTAQHLDKALHLVQAVPPHVRRPLHRFEKVVTLIQRVALAWGDGYLTGGA